MSDIPNSKPVHDHDHDHADHPAEAKLCCGHDHSDHHDHSHPVSGGEAQHGHEHSHEHGPDCCGHVHDHAAAEQAWTRRFLLFLEMAVLLIWAVFMVFFFASGRINAYLIGEGTFRIQALTGGLQLAVLGVFNWQMRSLPEDCGHDHEGGEDCGHDHSGDPAAGGGHQHEGTTGGRAMALLLLAVSVTTAVAFTPDQFSDQYKKNMLSAYAGRIDKTTAAPDAYRLTPEGSATEKAAGGMTLAVVEKYRPRNKAGNFELGVEELYYSSADPEYAKVMTGQGVETIGQMVKDTSSDVPGRWRVFVLQMTCCAADARPVSLPVAFEGPVPDLQEMGWFRLTGKIDYVEERGIPLAVLRATDALPTLRPREQRTLF